MLENCQSAKERWGGVSEIIDRWLHERQELLVLFYKITADKESREQRLPKLCQILVDYVSAGQFEVYDQLLTEGREIDDTKWLQEAGELFKTVDATTELILDFNDKYLETDDLETLDQDLSSLGETLETRFSTEDRMIAVLHTSHKDLVA